MKNELQALALDVTLLDDEGNEVDLSKIDGEESQPVVKLEPTTVVEEEIEEDVELDDIDDLETPVFTDGDEE